MTNASSSNFANISSNGVLKKKAKYVLGVYNSAGQRLTISEAHAIVRQTYPNETDRAVSTAVVGMVDKGVMLEGVERPCGITGVVATEYYINPNSLTKKDSLQRQILRQEARLTLQLQNLKVRKLKLASMP